VRVITQQTLEEFGYRVLLASNGAEAVAAFSEHRGEVALLLTDMMMPIMDGPATIAAIRALDPHVRVIAASGLHQDDKMTRATQTGVRHFLLKPYSTDVLLMTLHRALQEPADPVLPRPEARRHAAAVPANA
jgi:CheY-like chemotaxis protein